MAADDRWWEYYALGARRGTDLSRSMVHPKRASGKMRAWRKSAACPKPLPLQTAIACIIAFPTPPAPLEQSSVTQRIPGSQSSVALRHQKAISILIAGQPL